MIIRNRRLQSPRILTVLLFAAVPMVVQAEMLYQWEELDGSLTFSPTPPPEGSGIKYKVMDTTGSASNEITLADAPLSASALATQAAKQPARRTEILRQPDVAAPTEAPAQVLAYAPSANEASSADLPTGISSVNGSQALQAERPADAAATPQLQASSQKSRNCSDLGKRIVALENRIVHSSTNEEMDQVIMQISRYQKSYSAHCG